MPNSFGVEDHFSTVLALLVYISLLRADGLLSPCPFAVITYDNTYDDTPLLQGIVFSHSLVPKCAFSSKLPKTLPGTNPATDTLTSSFKNDSCATPRALSTTTFRRHIAAGPLGLAIVNTTCSDGTSTVYARSRASFRRHSIIEVLILHVSCRSRPSYSDSSPSSQTPPD